MTRMMFSIDGPEDRGQHDRERQERDHEEPLGDPHQDRADDAAEEAGDDADDRTDHHRQHGRGQSDEQADAGAVDELRHDAAAEVVGAERREVRRARPDRVLDRVDRPQARLVREQRRGQRHQHDEREDDEPDHAGAVPAEVPPSGGQRPPPPQPGDLPWGGGGHGVHGSRTRGSR